VVFHRPPASPPGLVGGTPRDAVGSRLPTASAFFGGRTGGQAWARLADQKKPPSRTIVLPLSIFNDLLCPSLPAHQRCNLSCPPPIRRHRLSFRRAGASLSDSDQARSPTSWSNPSPIPWNTAPMRKGAKAATQSGSGSPVSGSRHCTIGNATPIMTATVSNVRTQPTAVIRSVSSPARLCSGIGTLQWEEGHPAQTPVGRNRLSWGASCYPGDSIPPSPSGPAQFYLGSTWPGKDLPAPLPPALPRRGGGVHFRAFSPDGGTAAGQRTRRRPGPRRVQFRPKRARAVCRARSSRRGGWDGGAKTAREP
jgi:hypothetical protein